MAHGIRRQMKGIWFLVLGLGASLAVAALVGCTLQPAQSYPSKPIEMVVPASPGGSADILSRIQAPYLEKKWGQTVSVVNKAGGGGTVGWVAMLQSPPDGYTMGTYGSSYGYLNSAIQKDLPYRWDSGTHVALVAVQPLVFVVKGDSKYRTLKDLAEEIKADPTKLKYGSSGVAGPSTFATAQLAEAVNVDPNKLKLVPFQGGAPTIAAVAGGHVDFAAQNLAEVLELTRGGQLRALAITTPQRSKELPDLPTTREAGYPTIDHMATNGVYGPPKLPAEVVKKWEDTLAELVKDPQFVAEYEKTGVIMSYKNSKDFHSWVEQQHKWTVAIGEKLGLVK